MPGQGGRTFRDLDQLIEIHGVGPRAIVLLEESLCPYAAADSASRAQRRRDHVAGGVLDLGEVVGTME